MIALVLGGLAPVRAAQATAADKATAAPALSQNPEQKEEIAREPALAPERQADVGEEVEDVWLTLDVGGPEELRPGEKVQLQARLRNVGWATASGVHLRLREEPGMGLAGRASWLLPDLPAGESTTLELEALVIARPGMRLRAWVEATGGTLSRPTTALYTAIVTQPEAEEWAPGPGAGLWRSQVGQVEIELPANRDARIVRLRQRGLYERDDTLPVALLHRFELEAEDNQGQALHQFSQPLKLRWRYAEALPEMPLLTPPSFAWFDPETASWKPLPTRADAKRGVIETEIDHFSLFGVLAGSQEAPDDPFKDANADLFTGGMEYRFPLPLFQRPNGLAPSLALSYSSKRHKAQGEREDGVKSVLSSRQYDFFGRLGKETVAYESATGPGVSYQAPNWGAMPQSQYSGYSYDGLGRPTVVTHPDGSQVKTVYDYLNTTVRDELNHQVDQVADAWGRVVRVANYTGDGSAGQPYVLYGWASYEYDVLDRLDKVILPDEMPGNPVRMDPTYNLLGQKTAMSDPDLGAWSYGYDAAGNLTRQTDARGTVLCYEYDALNRLRYVREDQTAPKDCTGTLAWRTTHEYDTLNWQPVANGLGRRNRLNDGSGTTTWTYDGRGRVTKETKAINNPGGGTFVTQWGYDAADRALWMKYPGGNNSQVGEQVNFSYNPQGLLKTMVGTSTYVSSTTYSALGQTTERWLGSNVVRQKYTYAAAENFRLTGLQSGVSPNYNNLQNLSYTYDDAGNVLTITDAVAVGGSQTQTFTYDALNRLSAAQAVGGGNGAYSQVSYAYSNAGNITSFEGTAFTYQDAAHKHAVTHLGGAQKYWYDANGNASKRISGSQTTNLSYDAENRMIQTVIVSGTTTDFTYDGDGKLVKMKVGTTYTAIAGPHYQYSGSTPTQHYYAGDVRIGQRYNTTLLFHITDHLGSTNLTTNESGVLSAELRYRPFGVVRYTTGTLNTPYRYTGQRFVQNTGLYFYNARWYDPTVGRFLAADTIVPQPGNPGSLNRYSYVLNNPLKYADPSGHAECIYTDCNLVWHSKSGKVQVRNVDNSALYRLIAQVARGQGSASSQLDQVLGFTDSVFGNFNGIAGSKGDIGFKQEFRDDHLYGEQWGIERPASKQLGHFLTAVGMGYARSEFTRLGSLYAIVGHEQRTDGRGGVAGLETIGRIGAQLVTPSALDIFSFRIAVGQDAAGQHDERDFTLGTILDPSKHGDLSDRVGNSMEDLRLSVVGWRLGEMVRMGGLSSNQDVANWLALYVAGD